MATASFQTMSLGHQGKITKSRARNTVKPILKKLHSSHSEKNSLDLDRTWEDQQSPHLGYHTDDRPSFDCQDLTTNTRSARDVSFNLSATNLTKRTANQPSAVYNNTTSTSSAVPGPNFSSKHPNHTRSTSGASHISLATSASGRNGSFVHPFQQTPRTSTPPLVSYANSFASFDNIQRDSSPTTITEDEDPVESLIRALPASQLASPPSSQRPAGVPGAQRSGSLSDAPQPLRVATGWSSTVSASRPGHVGSPVNHTRSSDGQLSSRPSVTVLENSPLTSVAAHSPQISSPMASPVSTHTMPPLRSSLDMNQFRLRSRSDVDTATRQEQVRAARRKFDEKEKAKEEKYARAETRKRERADTKEAQRLERAVGHHRKGSYSGRTSSSTDIRPVFSRKNTGTSATRFDSTSEKAGDFVSRGYKEMAAGQSPRARADEVHFESSRRSTKRKPTGTWTAFVLWLRTRLLKLGRR